VASDKVKVFISWSGQLAKKVARVWRDLLDAVFDNVDPFMSEKDIEAGDRNLRKIADELSGTNFGIVVVTQENQNSRWLNYEAGALSKNVDEDSEETGRVVPSIVDFARAGDVERPLGQFQGKLLNEEGIRETLMVLAKVADADKDRIVERFDSLWSTAYEDRFAQAQTLPDTPAPKERDTPDKVDEILTIVRSAPDVDTVGEILTIVRDMSRTAKFGPPPMERGLRLPIDGLPLDEIRAVVDSFLGADHDIPITLSCDEECRLIVEVHFSGAGAEVGKHMYTLGDALMKIDGVQSVRIPIEAEPHMPPIYKEWADTVKSEVMTRRREMGIATEGN
jgi:hypothetical protein